MQNLTKQTIRIYWQHAMKYKFLLITTVVAEIFVAVCNTMSPLYVKKMIDLISTPIASGIDMAAVWQALLFFGLVSLGNWFGWRVTSITVVQYEANVLRDLANTCFQSLHKHSFSFFNNNFVGSLVRKVNRFVHSFEAINDRLLFDVLILILNTSIVIAVLFMRNLMLGNVMLIWVILFLGVNLIVAKFKLKYDLARSAADTRTSAHLADTVTNNANIKLFVGYNREVEKHKELNQVLYKKRLLSWNLTSIFEAIQGLFAIGLEVSLFYVAIYYWRKGLLTIGDFVLIQSYVVVVLNRVWDFGKVVRIIYENFADASEMTEILLSPCEIKDARGAKDLKIKTGRIEFVNVQFKYSDSNDIFDKLNLTIKPKEKIALVGPSGAGKSTIVKMLMRQHNIVKGKIFIDGQDIAKITLSSLWLAVGWVPQDPILFHRRLMENIRYGAPDASDEEVFEAAKLAHCHEFIKSFKEGYNTFVGERGVKLSGGERQRVAIARAILYNAPILLLDEATSSLDSESEHFIQEALKNLMENKTVIVVAHRLSTIMNMDRILVIEKGKVVEEGRHNELLKNDSGIYKKLWSLQAGGFVR